MASEIVEAQEQFIELMKTLIDEEVKRNAEKLAALSQRLAAAFKAVGRPVPAGWFMLLRAAVERSLTPMPANGAHEVGGGLFDDAAKAEAALDERLKDLDGAARQAQELFETARRHESAVALLGDAEAPAAAAIKGVASQVFEGPIADLAAKWTQSMLLGAGVGQSSSDEQAPNLSWWQDQTARHTAVNVPLYALRRDQNDPGVGKLTDLGRYYRDVLAKQGVDVVLLLPHFGTSAESPYAPTSLYAVNEDNVDWSQVDEVRGSPELLEKLIAPNQSVDYTGVRQREGAVAQEAYRLFKSEQIDRGTQRGNAYQEFVAHSASWLEDYAEFMVLSKLIGKPSVDWNPADVESARRFPNFQDAVAAHRYAQWIAGLQLKQALDDIHAAGGRALFDIPMFRSKNSVDTWKHPELFTDLKTRNPGIVNEWVHEDWKDLALWNWTKLKAQGYAPALDPYRHWLELGFDGSRVDALHFAYKFGNGQKASGDEPGDDYVRALSQVFHERGAFPLAEAFEGKDVDARKYGFVTVGGDWKAFSTHDDARRSGFLPSLLQLSRQAPSGDNAAFAAYTLGDEWADPFPMKQMENGASRWNYRIPLPSDPDYANRARRDVTAQLRGLKAAKDGDPFVSREELSATMGKMLRNFAGRLIHDLMKAFRFPPKADDASLLSILNSPEFASVKDTLPCTADHKCVGCGIYINNHSKAIQEKFEDIPGFDAMDHYVHVFYVNAMYEDIPALEKLKERFSSSKRYPVEHAKAIEKTKAYIEMYEALNKYITA